MDDPEKAGRRVRRAIARAEKHVAQAERGPPQTPRRRDYRPPGISCSAEHHQLVRPSTGAVCIGA
jgi:hypothetical protein